ncbi:MAG: 30S ribosomal protein S7, partial [Candidatus Paceibacterota bacterium]
MPRRPLPKKEDLRPDYKYNSQKVAKFINYVMLDGKKDVARDIVYDAFEELEKKHKVDDPLQTFNDALQNIGPNMEVRSRRIGGANYQVPREVDAKRRLALSMRWLLEIVRAKSGRPTSSILADELFAAAKGEGEAVKKKENVHRMA